jgi:hypothetical protein
MSELIRDIYRRQFRRALESLRAQAANTPASKLTMRQMDAEIAAARRARRRKPV